MDARSVTPADLDRFRKMLGMLGSDQTGERSAAALKCSSWLRDRGLSWSDVTLPVSGSDVLAQRREVMTKTFEEARREAAEQEAAIRTQNAKQTAARKAAWERHRYGADEDGFETGRK